MRAEGKNSFIQSVVLTAFAHHSFLHRKITWKNALNQPERGDLLATDRSGASVEIDPSNSSLGFTHNPECGETPSNSSLRCKHTRAWRTPGNNSLWLVHATTQYTFYTSHSWHSGMTFELFSKILLS